MQCCQSAVSRCSQRMLASRSAPFEQHRAGGGEEMGPVLCPLLQHPQWTSPLSQLAGLPPSVLQWCLQVSRVLCCRCVLCARQGGPSSCPLRSVSNFLCCFCLSLSQPDTEDEGAVCTSFLSSFGPWEEAWGLRHF